MSGSGRTVDDERTVVASLETSLGYLLYLLPSYCLHDNDDAIVTSQVLKLLGSAIGFQLSPRIGNIGYKNRPFC
jgi:hypothetical protein